MIYQTLVLLSTSSLILAKITELERSEGVYVLTTDNYDRAVSEMDNLLVYFYAPWCGHCKALSPEFVKAGQTLREKDSFIKLGKVDGTEEKELMDKHQITGYPTLKFYRRGEIVPYTGGRMAPEIVEWLEKKIGPPANILDSVEDVDNFISANDVAVVGIFTESGEEKTKYEKACLDYDDYGVHYPVGLTLSKEAKNKYGGQDGIILFKKFEEEQVSYSGDFSVESIRSFITENALPNLIEFNHENAQKMFKTPNDGKSHLLIFHNKSSESYNEEIEMLRRVSKEFREKVLFVSVDVEEEDHRRMVEFLGVQHRINNDTFPTMRIITMRDNTGPIRYKPEDTTVSDNNVINFVTAYIEGKIPRDYFVEPLPVDWNKNPVKYLTAVNLQSFIEDPSKHSLVMFYAPWCGHCKTLVPVWEELGVKYKDSDYSIGRMDATVNEIQGLDKINSFPTIKLYKKDGTQSEYNGERTVAGISKFMETDGVYGMAAPDHDEL